MTARTLRREMTLRAVKKANQAVTNLQIQIDQNIILKLNYILSHEDSSTVVLVVLTYYSLGRAGSTR